MKTGQLIALCLVASYISLGCKPKEAHTEVKHIKLQQQWFANSGFVGELVAANETASKYGISLEVLPGSDQIDTKQIIKLGSADIGVAGAEQIIQANEKGANLVVIGVINYKSLACFISMKDKKILKPSDFAGHKIGTMEGSPVDLVYQVLKKKEGLNIPKSMEVPTGWVLTGFTRGQYDVYPAFINDEPIKLRKEGTDLNILKPSDYGVDFIGTVYFCKKEMIEQNPEAIQSFVNAVSDGWKEALKDPKKAIALLKSFDKNIDETKELASLSESTEYYNGEGGKVLFCSESKWQTMAGLLKSINVVTKPFDYKSTVENKFVDKYHDDKEKK